jgi:hypothetical protein
VKTVIKSEIILKNKIKNFINFSGPSIKITNDLGKTNQVFFEEAKKEDL